MMTRPRELYDPATRTWTPTGSLNTPRLAHAATLLRDGEVLLAGGELIEGGPPIGTAELYEPASGIWTLTGSLNDARLLHTATLMANGKVLAAV